MEVGIDVQRFCGFIQIDDKVIDTLADLERKGRECACWSIRSLQDTKTNGALLDIPRPGGRLTLDMLDIAPK